VKEAMEVINFSPPAATDGGIRSHVANVFTAVTRLVTCDYFTLERIKMRQEFEQEIPYSEPVVWIVLEGQGVIQCEGAGPTAFAKGDTILLPADLKKGRVRTITDCAWLEARLPGGASEIN
jgi:hypothetical protein